MTVIVTPPADAWYPVAIASEVRDRPLARRLLGRPLVVFRAGDRIGVLADRCPHRGFPLSDGRSGPDGVQCPYHGWRFGPDGRCTATPGAKRPAGATAEAISSVVRDGLVWASLAPAAPVPKALPKPFGEAGQDAFWWSIAASRAHWIDAIENLLDPAHPHFIHPGLVRSAAHRRPAQVTVIQAEDWVEALYDEDRRNPAVVPRLIEGLRTRSIGRFFPPAVGQIAFDGPRGPRLTLTVIFTPEDADTVRPFAHFSTPRGLLPAGLKRAVLKLVHVPILAQDRKALARQAEALQGQPPQTPVIGPLDVLRPAIDELVRGGQLKPGVRQYQLDL